MEAQIETNESLTKEQVKQLKRRERYRNYYHTHKEHIAEYRKTTGVAHKSYENYYEKNKERIKERNLQRYYEKKAKQIPPASESEKIEE